MRECRRITIYTCVMSFCACAIFTTGGCVMQSTYDAALQDGMTTKAELAQARDEQQRLARQVGDMERLNADVVREAEAATAALTQAKDEAEQRRQQAEQQIVKLQQRVAQATKLHRSLEYELTVAKENAGALQELIDGFQRKIRDGAAVATTSATAERGVHKPFDPSTIPVPQDLPAAPAVTQAPPAPAPAPAPAPSPTPAATRPKGVSPQEDDGWLTSVKNWIMSLWHSVFS